jgi:hypothetical protein
MRPPGVRLIPSSNLDALSAAIEEVLSARTEKGSRTASTDETNIEAVFQVYHELMNRK